ncbi:MAG: hypothetical protein U0670_17085 [Anaerolineae bacterium]
MAYYQYPLQIRFKLVALSPQMIVTDASGRQIAYVHQKVWNLREDIRIYTDQSRQTEVFRINADRIMDFNAKYNFTESATGRPLGYVQPKGLRSIWRATYLIYAPDGTPQHHIREDNPWIKVLDALVSEISILNLFTGYFLNPAYTVYRGSDREDISQPMLLKKMRPSSKGISASIRSRKCRQMRKCVCCLAPCS